jgi:hypothetical protein
MIFFVVVHYRRFSSEVVGSRLIQVCCEKCNREYYYVLSRLGSGEAISAYGLGNRRAEDNATKGASHELMRQLTEDADLVPCPNCHWVNDDLVKRYRRGSYRGWVRAGGFMAALGGSTTFIVGCVNGHGPQAGATDGGLMLSGPLFFLVLWAAVAVAPLLLRKRIQPNRDFPFQPTVPPGSPPALLLDAETGELTQVVNSCPASDRDEKIYFAVGRDTFPLNCCGCGRECSIEWTIQIPALRVHQLPIPICKTCMSGLQRSQRKVGLAFAAAGLIVCLAFWGYFQNLAAASGFGGVTVLLLVILYSYVAGIFSCPVTALLVSHRRGIVRLRCRNTEYRTALSEFFRRPRTYTAREQADAGWRRPWSTL